jgi:hypothetical protein
MEQRHRPDERERDVSGAGRVGVGGTWPPDPATIDLRDPVWLSYPEAEKATRHGRRQLEYLALKRPDIWIKIGRNVYFHHSRLIDALLWRNAG